MTALLENTLSSVTAGTGTCTPLGYFTVSISGTFSATVALQRKLPGQATFQTVKSWTAPTEEFAYEVEDGTEYRWNMTARTSGTAVCRLGQGLNKYLAYKG